MKQQKKKKQTKQKQKQKQPTWRALGSHVVAVRLFWLSNMPAEKDRPDTRVRSR